VQKLFPITNKDSQTDQIQSRLMILAALFMITYGLILSIAPSVRNQTASISYRLDHWVGVVIWAISFALLHRHTAYKLQQRDPFLLPIVAMLNGLGLMTIYRLYPNFGIKQTAWLGLAMIVCFIGIQFPFFINYLRKYKYIWLISGLILTAFTLLLGSNPTGTGPTLWLKIFGVHIQPSELLKLLLLIYLAGYFADHLVIAETFWQSLLPNLLVTSTAVLLLINQRDLGTASIFLMLYLAMLFATRRHKMIMWIAPFAILIAGILGYFFIEIVQLRIDTWLYPFRDPSGASYQIIQSLIAIAEGGLIGTGPGLGSPGLIPVSVSDFIFSAIAEELGFFGIIIVITLFILLLYRGIKIALETPNVFHRYLALGIVFYFGNQTILIIGGNIGVLPLTGVTLPFVSYGGSSLLVSFSALLILIIISHQTPSKLISVPQPSRRILFVGGFMILVLVLEMLSASLISYWFSPFFTTRAENPRWVIDDRFRPRGNILDRNNQVIITNSGESGNYSRESNHIPLYPVIGYTSARYGQTGIEASMFPYLRGYDGNSYETVFWQNLLYNQPPDGLHVRLTIDLSLQKTADELLENVLPENFGGTAVLMNASSGEILVMASHPYFNAADLETGWENLVTDEAAPLVNRATQGLFPPGTALLPFVATTQINTLRQFPDPQTFLINPEEDKQCTLTPDDDQTWETLISNGCQTVQIELAEITGMETLLEVYQDLGFFSEPALNLDVAEVGPPEQIDDFNFYSGENTFTISPLQMALAASTLTNQGIRPGPRLVSAYQDPEGVWITVPKFAQNIQVLPTAAASQVTELLQSSTTAIWQVSSTTTTDDAEVISWYVAGTTQQWQGQPTVVVVLLETFDPIDAKNIGLALMEGVLQTSTALVE